MTLADAIRAGDRAAVAEQLRAGADPNERDPDGLTPLMVASGYGEPQIVELLLDAGADVLAVEPRMGATALHKAAQSGDAAAIALLLDRGAFIDQQSPILGNTPLIDAVLYKNEAAVRTLLDRGARTGTANHWRQTALELARSDGLQTIARLIEARIDTDADRLRAMPLVAAVKAGDAAEVERLIAAGAAVYARVPVMGSPDDDYTPLGIAAREGHAEIARILLRAGADPCRVTGLYRGTPVHEASYFGHLDVLSLLLDRSRQRETSPIPLDAQGPYNGMTALHDAVWHGHAEAARLLVEARARLDLRSHAGRTAREDAVAYDYSAIADLLAAAERR